MRRRSTNMEQVHSRRMAAEQCWSPVAAELSAKRPPWGWPRWGAHLGITGPDRGRTDEAAREIRAAGGGQVDVVGGFWNTRHVTTDGLERTFALNHLAPFLLTNLLLDRLKQSAPPRVVAVASRAQAMGRIEFDDLQGERSYSGASRLQPVQTRHGLVHLRAGQAAASHVRHRQCAASRRGAHLLRSRGPRPRPATVHPIPAAFHEDPGPGRRDAALAGQRRAGRPARGCLNRVRRQHAH